MTSGSGKGRFARILVPTDGSDTSEHALEVALEVAENMGSHVTGLYVMDSSAYAAFPGDLEWESIKAMLEQESKHALSSLEEQCEALGLGCHVEVREGHPAQEIIQASDGHDLVVMGTHGRSGLDHLLMGSVTEKVIRHAPIPVLVVRTPEDEDA
ncbi:MAG: universal stress protein [Candidatus Thermoplasmatota archaeon]|nr:universal stress protein [Candidatus Thermoplasmatota archaeon]